MSKLSYGSLEVTEAGFMLVLNYFFARYVLLVKEWLTPIQINYKV